MKTSLLLGLAVTAMAANAVALDKDYFSIGTVEVRELPSDEQALKKVLLDKTDEVAAGTEIWFEKADGGLDPDVLGDMIGLTGSEVGVFMRIGKEVWSIIKENQPVMNTSYGAVSVLPKDLTDWNQMENWQAPQSKAYQIVYKNLYGIEVVRFSYRLNYTAGGTFNGQGQYLSNIAVSPIHVRVLWGFTLNADVSVNNIQNTATTAEPVPGVEVLIKYDVSTIFVKEERGQSFYVRGDGYSQALSNR